MKTISTFVIAFIIIGFFFLVLPEKGNAGIPTMPGGPPCCEVTEQIICQGGEAAVGLCQREFCQEGGCQFFDNAICVEEGQGSGRCIANTARPTLIPSTAKCSNDEWLGIIIFSSCVSSCWE